MLCDQPFSKQRIIRIKLNILELRKEEEESRQRKKKINGMGGWFDDLVDNADVFENHYNTFVDG